MPNNGTTGRASIFTKWLAGSLQFLDSSGNVIATFHKSRAFRLGTTNAPIAALTKATLSTQNVTPTAAQLYGGLVEHATVTAGGTFTLDTAAHIDAAIPGVADSDSFQCVMANTGTQTSTITTNTGLTLVGTAAVTTGKTALLTFFRTGTAAWTVYIRVSA